MGFMRRFNGFVLAGLVFALAVLLVGAECGEQAEATKVGEVTQAPAATEAATEAPTVAPVETKEATEAPTATPAPTQEATEAPEATPEPTEEPTEAPTATPEATEEPTEAPTQAATEPASYAVGDIIEISDFALVALGWDTVTHDLFKPGQGNQFVAIELVLVNQGDSPVAVSTLLQMSLKDSTDQQYTLDIGAQSAITEGSPDGELAAGEKIRGKIGFQVPEDASGLVFVFEPNLLGTGKVFIDLGDSPISLDPPAELPGEIAPDAFKPGDIVEIGDFTLVVNGVESSTGSDFVKPAEGNEFVIVDLTLENKRDESVAVSSLLQMSLKDATGQIYAVNLLASTAGGGTTPDGELAAGEKLRGQVGFEVPSDAEGLLFVFDPNIIGTGRAFVALD